ncbi:MAG: hypothetical protein GY804_00220 [Alphaproteobacteria bacterium]|nr:hypothetical protein [Alphaproteobacteria bacterium]
MVTSHDNFFVTTLIDRATGESTRVKDIVSTSDIPIKAWVSFDAKGTLTINDSFNVSSITDNSAGDYTINFTTPFSDVFYLDFYSAPNASNVQRGGSFVGIALENPTTYKLAGSVRIQVFLGSTAASNAFQQDLDAISALFVSS